MGQLLQEEARLRWEACVSKSTGEILSTSMGEKMFWPHRVREGVKEVSVYLTGVYKPYKGVGWCTLAIDCHFRRGVFDMRWYEGTYGVDVEKAGELQPETADCVMLKGTIRWPSCSTYEGG